ncbi:MAG: hypothetical protein WBY44_09165 [Bryobacteraceae bacterium]
MKVCFIAASLTALAFASADDYGSAKRKLDLIDSNSLRPGAKVTLSPRELNAYVAHEVPPGVRNTALQIVSPGVATGSALIDFGKVRRAQGHPPGWLMSKLLDGERPVKVTARVLSSKGHATVEVQRVEVSGVEIDGRTLDFLVQNLLLPMYPNAAIDRPFELGHRIERLELEPAAVGVVIGR